MITPNYVTWGSLDFKINQSQLEVELMKLYETNVYLNLVLTCAYYIPFLLGESPHSWPTGSNVSRDVGHHQGSVPGVAASVK